MTQFAMVFPGQGSQSVGALAELASHSAIIEKTFKEASDVLGYDLWALTQNGPIEELNQTWKTQPVLLASSVAVWRMWQEKKGAVPVLLAGHSLGEYSALTCAEVIDFQDAIRLVELRGKLMQEAVPAGIGSMVAILGLDNDVIIKICQETAKGDIVAAVNFNSPGQVVIAGHKTAVERASSACLKAGAKRALPLTVSIPSHCLLMGPVAKKLAAALEEVTFKTPIIPVINNSDVKIEASTQAIRTALVKQMYSPVRWTETIEYIVKEGVKVVLEVGAGKVLTGLNKRIDSTIKSSSINDLKGFDAEFIAKEYQ